MRKCGKAERREARPIGATGMHYDRIEWFPDGQRLLVTGNDPGRRVRAFIQDVNGGNLIPADGGVPKIVAGVEARESVIRWSADGRFLFLRRSEEPSAVKIERLDIASGRKETWRELRTPDPVGVQIGEIVMTPDGTAYAYSFERNISTLYLAKGLK